MKVKYYLIIGFVIAVAIIALAVIVLPDLMRMRLDLSHHPNLNALDGVIKAKVLNTNETVKQFTSLYSDTFPLYGSYVKPYQPYANFQKPFYQRYVLELEVCFYITQDGKDVSGVGPAKLELTEYEQVSHENSESIARIGFKKTLTLDDWRKIVDAKGDISVIIPNIKKDQPVKGVGGLPLISKEELFKDKK